MPRDFCRRATEPSTVKVVVNTRQDALYLAVRRFPIRAMLKKRATWNTWYLRLSSRCAAKLQSIAKDALSQIEELEQLRLMNAGINIRRLRLPQPVRASTPQHAWKKSRPDGTGTGWKRMIGIYSPGSGVFRIWRNFWRNRARNFLCAPCSAKRRCYRRVGTSSQRAKPVAIAKAAGKPVIRLEDGLCVRWILASMASRRFLWWWILWHLLRCQQAFSTGETGKG